MVHRFRSLRPFAVLFAATAVLAACDNPVEGEDEVHPAGLIVADASGAVVARYQNLSATGRVETRLGAPGTFTVTVVDEEGRTLAVDGDELSLSASSEGGVATAALTAGTRLVVTPTRAGTGQLRLAVSHDGHEEFAATFPLVVNP